jgi:type I restriction enzyme S subunit
MSERSQVQEQKAVRDAAPAYRANALEIAQGDVPPGYERTEVGVIPEDWALRPLSEIFKFSNGVNADKAAYGHGIPFINVLEPITYSHIRAADIPGKVKVSRLVANLYAIEYGDIVFNRTSETQEEVGLAAVYIGSQSVLFGGFVIRARPIKSVLDPLYAGYGLRVPAVRSQIITKGQGAVRANVGQESLQGVLAPIPPSNEQRAIATALSDADALIESLDRLIAKKRAIKQAAMQQLLTGETRLPGFEGGWERKNFEGVLRRMNVKDYQIQTSDYRSTGRYPVVDQGQEPVIGFTDRAEKVFSCPAGGVIVFGDHTCIVKFVDVDFAVGADGTQILWGRGGISTRFVAYQLEAKGIEPTGYNRHFKFLKEREFVVPTLEEQEAIARTLGDMDAEIYTLERRREKARQIKRGMMQELLTGRTRLVEPQQEAVEEAEA